MHKGHKFILGPRFPGFEARQSRPKQLLTNANVKALFKRYFGGFARIEKLWDCDGRVIYLILLSIDTALELDSSSFFLVWKIEIDTVLKAINFGVTDFSYTKELCGLAKDL